MQNNVQASYSKSVDDKTMWSVAERTAQQVKETDAKFEQILDETKRQKADNESQRSLHADLDRKKSEEQDDVKRKARANGAVPNSHKDEINTQDNHSTKGGADSKSEKIAETKPGTTTGHADQVSSVAGTEGKEAGSKGSTAGSVSSSDTNVKVASGHSKDTELGGDNKTSTEHSNHIKAGSGAGESIASEQTSADQAKNNSLSNHEQNQANTTNDKVSASANKKVSDNVSSQTIISPVPGTNELEQTLKEMTTNDTATWLNNVISLASNSKGEAGDVNSSQESANQSEQLISKELADFQTLTQAIQATINGEVQGNSDDAESDAASDTITGSDVLIQEASIQSDSSNGEESDSVNSAAQNKTAEQAIAQSNDNPDAGETNNVSQASLSQVTGIQPQNAVQQNVQQAATNPSASTADLVANVINKDSMTQTGQQQLAADAEGQQSLKELAVAEKLAERQGVHTNTVTPSILQSAAPVDTSIGGQETLSRVELAGVSLEKAVSQARQETQTQIKQDVIIKENVLFNKQELAANVQQQVGMMLARNLKSVDIRLDPPELGSMKIKMNINGEQAAVSFVVSSQQAKDALENAMPKLREMLEQQGMMLADSDVKHDNSGQGASGGAADGSLEGELGNQQNGADDELEGDAQDVVVDVPSPYKVDYYA